MRTILCCCAVVLASACSSTPSCKTAHDCSQSQRCVSSVCKASSESPGAVGDSCAAASECGAGLTCNTAGYPGGFCTEACTPTSCTAGACADLSTGPLCAATCSTDNDCRVGYGCCAALGNVCVPAAACVSPACQRPIGTSSLPAAQVLVHGVHQVGDVVPFTVPAGTASITIVEQAQLATLNIVYKSQVTDNSAVPGVITRPDSSKAYDDNDPVFQWPTYTSPDGGTDPSGVYSYYPSGTPVTVAFTIPNTTKALSAGVPAGNWSFQVNDYAYECAQSNSGCTDGGVTTNTYDVTVLAKPAAPAGSTPTLDLALYIVADMSNPVTGQALNAANAPNDPSVKRLLNTLAGFYSAAGITIGTRTFYDVSSAARARFGTHINADQSGPCDDLNQMFLLSADHPGNTVNLFLVQSITSKANNGGVVVGIDGTIPGPSTIAGTVHSGAAVSIADLFSNAFACAGAPTINCGADKVAFIAGHETGHFLGLVHTTEFEGTDFDPIADTPKCPCFNCASSTDLPHCSTGGTSSSPIFLSAVQCSGSNPACAGADNLMFPQLQVSISQGKISAQQAKVMLLNPAVHP